MLEMTRFLHQKREHGLIDGKVNQAAPMPFATALKNHYGIPPRAQALKEPARLVRFIHPITDGIFVRQGLVLKLGTMNTHIARM